MLRAEGGSNAESERFYDHMVSGGVPYVIALSYYPFFHGPLADRRANVDALATRYGKPIVIAESQYPWTLANGDSTGNSVCKSSQASDGYPSTPGGQLSFYNDMPRSSPRCQRASVRDCSTGSPSGFRASAGSPTPGRRTTTSRCFPSPGRLPSVGLFQNPVAVCAR